MSISVTRKATRENVRIGRIQMGEGELAGEVAAVAHRTSLETQELVDDAWFLMEGRSWSLHKRSAALKYVFKVLTGVGYRGLIEVSEDDLVEILVRAGQGYDEWMGRDHGKRERRDRVPQSVARRLIAS